MTANKEAFEQAKNFIESKQRFLMATHPRTDGDDGGSMLALTSLVESMGKVSTPVAKFGIPAHLMFLPGSEKLLDHVPNDATEEFYDGIILFGCSNRPRVGLEKIIESKLPILNIDHHHDNVKFGEVNMVDFSKSSVAELMFDFFEFWGIKFTPDIAKCLLTGMFTDTGSFMHAGTKPSTLAAAAELMKYGARVDKIYKNTYQSKDLQALKAWARAIENTRLIHNNKVAISVMTQEDLDAVAPIAPGAFDGLVESLNQIPGVRFAIFLRQEDNEVKASMRSEEGRNMDVSFLAKIFGGGGHKLSSGFEIPGKIIKEGTSWKIIKNEDKEKSTQ